MAQAPSTRYSNSQANRRLLQMCHDQLVHLQSPAREKGHDPTVFDTTLNPNLEKGQFTPPMEHLAADAFVFIVAGTDTSSHTIVTGLFALLYGQPHMMRRLKAELQDAIPDVHTMKDWALLERLPYLVLFPRSLLLLKGQRADNSVLACCD